MLTWISIFPELQGVAWLPRGIRVHGQIPRKDYNLLGETDDHVHELGPLSGPTC